MKKLSSKILILVFFLSLGVFGCGSSGTEGGRALGDGSSTGSPSNLGGPTVGNLPPPAKAHAESAPFFKDQELYGSYSSEMRTIVKNNYETSLKRLSPEAV